MTTDEPPGQQMARRDVAVGTRRVDAIRVGVRHRAELGDVEGLARSIADVGLLHPVVVTPDGGLIAGERRLAACRLLGWQEVPVTVIDLDDVVRGEWAENNERKDLTPSEAVAVGRVLEEVEREKARKRRGARKDWRPTGNFPVGSFGRTAEIVGRAVGMSAPTYQRARSVVAAAEEDPATFGPIAEEMDRTGKVQPAYDEVRALRGAPAVPEGKGRAAVAERRRRVLEMARQGYREESIADALRIDRGTVSIMLRRSGVPTMAQKIGRRASGSLSADRMMDGIVENAEPPGPAVRAIEWPALSPGRFGDWDERLTAAIRVLSLLRSRLRKMKGNVA